MKSYFIAKNSFVAELTFKISDHTMTKWIYGVKVGQQHSTEELRRRLDLQHVEDVIRWNRDCDCLVTYIDKKKHHGQRKL